MSQAESLHDQFIWLNQAVARVRELHKPTGCDCSFHKTNEVWCKSCYKDYPCPTIKALEGEQE